MFELTRRLTKRNPLNMVTLYYLDRDQDYVPGPFLADEWAWDWYHQVTQAPKLEMLGVSEVNVAEELLHRTSSANWRKQYRRPIRCGDILCWGCDPWLFIPADSTVDFCRHDNAVKPLQQWPNFALASISSET